MDTTTIAVDLAKQVFEVAEANRAGRMDEFWAIYERAFQEPAAQLALLEAEELCRASATALLCFCGDASHCHRDRIARALT